MSSLKPSRHRLMLKNGSVQMMNGSRRPHLLRYLSLLKLRYGVIPMFRIPGTVVIIIPNSQFGHPSAFNFSGMMLGTTASISVKQKSPHSSQAKSAKSPNFV